MTSRPQKAKKLSPPPPPLTRMEKDTSICTVNALLSLPTAKVQLWQFPGSSESNSSNYEFENGKHLTGETMLWSKPNNFDSYDMCQNICLIHHEVYTDVCIISQTGLTARDHWEPCHSINGVIEMKRVGRIYASKRCVAVEMCRYVRWNIGGKFQPIKKVTFREFIDNVKDYYN